MQRETASSQHWLESAEESILRRACSTPGSCHIRIGEGRVFKHYPKSVFFRRDGLLKNSDLKKVLSVIFPEHNKLEICPKCNLRSLRLNQPRPGMVCCSRASCAFEANPVGLAQLMCGGDLERALDFLQKCLKECNKGSKAGGKRRAA